MKTISEIRIAFDMIENEMKKMLQHGKTKKEMSNILTKKWKKHFGKKITEQNAMEYLSMLSTKNSKTLKNKKRTKGGNQYLSGAPLDYTMRPGTYISAGVNNGSYAQTPVFIEKGFTNPHIAQLDDPIKGQPSWPTVPVTMGNNTVKSGGRRKNKTMKGKRRGGNLQSTVQQFLFKPIQSTIPPSNLQVRQDMWQGLPPFPSSSPMK